VNHDQRLIKSWNNDYSVKRNILQFNMRRIIKQGLTLASPLSNIITSPTYC
jgi:hypothetical protein